MAVRKWSKEDIVEARRLADSGEKTAAIAVHFGVTWNSVNKLLIRTAAKPKLQDEERARRKIARVKRRHLSPLADPLVAALFEHHRERAPESLLRRLLPAPVNLPVHISMLRPAPPPRKRMVKPAPPPRPEVIILPTRIYPSLMSLMNRVLHKHDMTEVEFLANTHAKRPVRARQEFFYLAALETVQSLPQIGRFVGGRDHTTILHGITAHCVHNNLPPPRGQFLTRSQRSRAAFDRAAIAEMTAA